VLETFFRDPETVLLIPNPDDAVRSIVVVIWNPRRIRVAVGKRFDQTRAYSHDQRPWDHVRIPLRRAAPHLLLDGVAVAFRRPSCSTWSDMGRALRRALL
jgi:hypothetical protein